jgi:hypothetical protein
MKAILITIGSLAVLAATLFVVGCNRANAAPGGTIRGKSCTIQFRRDALGAAAALPVSPLTGSINGAETSISGTFVRFNDEWIVIESRGNEIWVPRAVVLLLQWPQ